MAETYMNRILAAMEKHMTESAKENKSAILYATTLRNSIPTEQICKKLLQNILTTPEFAQFKDKFLALQKRYEAYFPQIRDTGNEN